jgi:hypothetical protein
MAFRGYFVVADITGYTMFLTQTELEHAEKALGLLFEDQLKQFQSPLVVNSFRGDAILAYALEGSFAPGLALVETLDRIYASFRDRGERIARESTCGCNACSSVPSLDLKFFVHFGSFMLQKMGDREEMLGADVIVVHRMMKNQVKEQTGAAAYALLSEAAVSAMSLGDDAAAMKAYVESYEHIGEVKMRVHDLRAAFERRREGRA